MSLRTNPDRILENIDRQRSRDEESAGRPSDDRQAVGRELDTTPPPSDATNPELMKRVFGLVEQSYRQAAHGSKRTSGQRPTRDVFVHGLLYFTFPARPLCRSAGR